MNNVNLVYEIKDIKNFNPKHTFECGQCFRWNKNKENTGYIGVVSGVVLEVIKKQLNNGNNGNTRYLIYSNEEKSDKLISLIENYFDINTDYSLLKKQILEKTKQKEMKEAIDFGYGIRILNQELLETMISFVISANNNIPRIKNSIEDLSKKYGDEIMYKGEIYYSFPSFNQMYNLESLDFRECGVGYRDKHIVKLLNQLKSLDKEYFTKEKNGKTLSKKLESLSGIGPKVADCIKLFALKQKQAFPVDTWVRRVVNKIYFKLDDDKKLKRKDILEYAKKEFGDNAGLSQQYLFYWIREKEGNLKI